MAFESALIVRDNNGFPFELVEPLKYFSKRLNAEIVVPAGFKTDYASIPRALWALLPPVGSYDKAAVIHDFLYQTGTAIGRAIDRGDADGVLKDAMEELGTGRMARWTIYLGVRSGGWAIWKHYRERTPQA